MVPERLAWVGGVIMSCVGIYVSYVPIANDLGKGLVAGLAGLVILAAILMFPWRRRSDGSPARLYKVKVGGRGNRVQTAGDNSTQVIANGDATIHAPGRPSEEGSGR
jgi:hypothetical protein